MNWLAFNTAKKPLNDVNVRKAIALTIDKKFISKALHGGFSKPADGPIVSSSPFAIPDVITYPLDLKKAAEMLDAAGYKAGANGERFKLTIDYLPGQDEQQKNVAEYIRAQLKKVGVMVDVRASADFPSWAKRIGVNLDEMLVSQPDTGEQALEICEMLVRSNAVDIIVIDSVAALIPKAEIEGDMGDSQMGLQARLMSQALRKLTGAIAKSECIVIFINQLREKIGVMFGSPETTTGGKALKFYSSVRIDIRRIGAIKDGDRNIGNRVRAKVVKNKIAPPFREAEFDIMFNEGISTTGDLVDLAVEDNIIEKSGSWFNYKTTRIGQGRENAKGFLRENPALFAEIRQRVIEKRMAANEAANRGKGPAPKDAADDDE